MQNGRAEVTFVYDLVNDVMLSEENTKFVGASRTQDFCEDAVRFTT